jgi:hypothetical protein
MSDRSVAFTPSPGQPLCFTSTETKETVRVGAGEDEGFFAFGTGREGGAVFGRLFASRFDVFFLESEEEEEDFLESEWDFGLRIGSPLLRRRSGPILSPST